MTDATARQLNRSLYGRPRIPRSHRRAWLALLAVPGLAGIPLSRLAMVSPATARTVLGRLECLGWAGRERHDDRAAHLRFTYSLTPQGRAAVTLLLGIEAGKEAGHG